LVGQAHAVKLAFTGTLAVQIDALDPVVVSGAGFAIVNGDALSRAIWRASRSRRRPSQ
jgi:hypothetical protein